MNLTQIRQELKFLKNDKQIIAVLLFGSYIKDRNYSRDIDICLVLDRKYTNNEMTKKRLYCTTILHTKFDIQIFQQLPLYIKKRILEENKILFCRDQDRMYEIAINTVKEYNLFEKGYNYYLESIYENDQ